MSQALSRRLNNNIYSAQFGDDLPLEMLVILFMSICSILGFHIGAMILMQHLQEALVALSLSNLDYKFNRNICFNFSSHS